MYSQQDLTEEKISSGATAPGNVPDVDIPVENATALIPFAAPANIEFDFDLNRLPPELRMMVWRRSRGNRVLTIPRRRVLHHPTFTLLDILDVAQSPSELVGTFLANHESHSVALTHYPLAFGTNTSHLAGASAQLGQNVYTVRTPFSAAHDIIFIDDLANVGLQIITPLITDNDRRSIQRLAISINTTKGTEVTAFISQLCLFPSLRELILIVDDDAWGHGDWHGRRHSHQGFQAITAAWATSITNHYNDVQAEDPRALRPVVRFEIPGWDRKLDGSTPAENRSRLLGVIALNRHTSIRGQDGLEQGARSAIRERAWSL